MFLDEGHAESKEEVALARGDEGRRYWRGGVVKEVQADQGQESSIYLYMYISIRLMRMMIRQDYRLSQVRYCRAVTSLEETAYSN